MVIPQSLDSSLNPKLAGNTSYYYMLPVSVKEMISTESPNDVKLADFSLELSTPLRRGNIHRKSPASSFDQYNIFAIISSSIIIEYCVQTTDNAKS